MGQVELPRQLVMMTDDNPIVAYGSYKVPLNLRDPASGQQVELAVQVNKTYRWVCRELGVRGLEGGREGGRGACVMWRARQAWGHTAK